LAYTTQSRVREEFSFMFDQENQTGKTGSTLNLKEVAYAIERIERDGVALTGGGTDFTFLPPRQISLVTPAVAADQYVITSHVTITTEALTAHITKAENIINARMVRVFGESVVPWTVAPAIIAEITIELAGCLALRTMVWGNHSLSQKAKDWSRDIKKEVDEKLEMIEEGRMEVIGETPTGDTLVTVGNAGTQIFVPLDDLDDVDASVYYPQENRRTEDDRSTIDP